MMKKLVLALAGIVSASTAVLAQLPLPLPIPPILPVMQGTPEDRAACGPDANRLCKQYLPDQMQVLACFKANRQQLSPACRGVLDKYGQ
jgi:hypothetical protein